MRHIYFHLFTKQGKMSVTLPSPQSASSGAFRPLCSSSIFRLLRPIYRHSAVFPALPALQTTTCIFISFPALLKGTPHLLRGEHFVLHNY
jgi:hypothetical protein